MPDTLADLEELIARVVTGDNEQLENVSMTDEEWKAEIAAQADPSVVDVTISAENWLHMVRVARAACL